MSKLWYEQPAAEWEEALPIGNGRLGAMVYGGIQRERIQLNEESMWYGGKVNRINPDFRENLPKIRKLLNDGEIAAAEALMDKAMSGCPDSMHPYQTLGEIEFTFYGMDEKEITGYRRSLDLERAVTSLEFSHAGTMYRREIFSSKPGDCIVMRFTAEGSGTVDLSARMRRSRFFDGVGRSGDDSIELYGNLGKGGYEFSMLLCAEVIGDGRVVVTGECLDVENAKEVELYFTADTTYHCGKSEIDEWMDKYEAEYVESSYATRGVRSADSAGAAYDYREENGQRKGSGAAKPAGKKGMCPAEQHFLNMAHAYDIPEYERQEYLNRAALQVLLHNKNEERIQACAEKTYKTLCEEHEEDFRALYGRFVFELEGDDAYDGLPTDRRLRQAKEGHADIGLSRLLFDFGRYLTIACSRAGGLPSTLQGLWNKDFTPPWDSKYTININTEMNYWPVEVCNLSECHKPLFDLLEKVRKTGRVTAREMYGCRGFVAHHNTDIHGDSAPQDIWYPGSYWPMGGAWLSTHLWMHYQYTKDGEFLKYAFPVLAESALFFVDFLTEKDGYLMTNPSVSPENTYRLPNGQSGSCCIGPTMDNQILRHLFTACVDAWEALGEKAPEGCEIEDLESVPKLIKKIKECRDRLNPTKISDSGRIMEWPEDYEEVEPGHRHISHLYGLYPAGEITVDGTPELAAAARKTLEYRLSHGGGHTGWSRAWIMNHYACLWDGEAAYDNIEKMLSQSTYPNLFDRHPPFQIDGNFGACAAMCGMLAQSNEERVVLLPALPKAWKSGSVKGLRLVGNAELAMSWKDGKLLAANIRADSDYKTTVVYDDHKLEVSISAGQSRTMEF